MNRLCLLLIALLLFPVSVFAQDDAPTRPLTEKLLPETTVLFVQLRDIKNFIEAQKESGIGRMLNENEQVAGLKNQLIEELQNTYEEFAQEDVGLELSDFQNLPEGEITLAIIAPKRDDLQYVLFVEVDEESEAFQNVLNRGREVAEERGDGTIVDEAGEVAFETFLADGVEFTTFQKEGLFVSASDRGLAEEVLERWAGLKIEKSRPLTENRRFVTVMNRCRGTKDIQPDFRFFVDPIALAKGATRGNIGAQTAINFLPILGLDGVSAVGASVILDELGYETVSHAHLMLANPRAGVVKMMALKSGEYRPESWVPQEIATYMSTSWNFNQFIAEYEKIVDTFAGEGAFKGFADDGFEENFGLDLREDLLPAFSGRVTYVNWIDFPAQFESNIQVAGFHIEDMDKFEILRGTLLEWAEERGEMEDIEEVEYRGVTYWREKEEVRQNRRERRLERRRERDLENGGDGERRVAVETSPNICIGVIDDCLVVCGSPKFMEKAIDTSRGELPSLADNEEFSETTETMVRLLKNDKPGAIFFQKPETLARLAFDLAKNEQTGILLDRFQPNEDDEEEGARPRVLRNFRSAFEENPLPDFEEVRHFFAPSGGFVTNDETGYHLMTFNLKYDRDE